MYSHLKVTYHLYDFSDYTPKGEQVFWVAVYRGLVFTLGYHLVFKKKTLVQNIQKVPSMPSHKYFIFTETLLS